LDPRRCSVGAQAVLHGAFITLLLVWVLATVERAWSPRRLLLFGLLGAVCVLVAHSAAFVMAAALAGLALNSLLRRAWRRLAWSALTAAGVWAIQLAVYLAFVAPANSAAMRAYWTRLFIPTDQAWTARQRSWALAALGSSPSSGSAPGP
jgi:hypothetical protein